MNKTEVVDVVAQRTGVSKTDTDKVISTFFELAAENRRRR